MLDSVRQLCIIADKARAMKCEKVVRASVRKLFIRARASLRKLFIRARASVRKLFIRGRASVRKLLILADKARALLYRISES